MVKWIIASHETIARNGDRDRRRAPGLSNPSVPLPLSSLSRPDRVYRTAKLPAEAILRTHSPLRLPVDLLPPPPDLANIYRPWHRHPGPGTPVLSDSRSRLLCRHCRTAQPLPAPFA